MTSLLISGVSHCFSAQRAFNVRNLRTGETAKHKKKIHGAAIRDCMLVVSGKSVSVIRPS